VFNLSNDTELKEKEHVNEDVYDKDLLDRLLQDGDIDVFREEFLSMHNYEQSAYFETSIVRIDIIE
jgi:magnesium transporter